METKAAFRLAISCNIQCAGDVIVVSKSKFQPFAINTQGLNKGACCAFLSVADLLSILACGS